MHGQTGRWKEMDCSVTYIGRPPRAFVDFAFESRASFVPRKEELPDIAVDPDIVQILLDRHTERILVLGV